jgi:predicted transcriptional regulator YdeE
MDRLLWLLPLLVAVSPPTHRHPGRPVTNIEERKGFYVVGLARRTNNAREAAGQGEIGKVWLEFTQEHVAEKIDHPLDENLVAVYTDYESDQHGDYTYLLGKKVADLLNLPAGLVGRHVPSGRYAIFVSEKGPLVQVVPKTWERIWSTSVPAMGGRRAFEADYEIYDERARDPQDGQVAVYVGLQ